MPCPKNDSNFWLNYEFRSRFSSHRTAAQQSHLQIELFSLFFCSIECNLMSKFKLNYVLILIGGLDAFGHRIQWALNWTICQLANTITLISVSIPQLFCVIKRSNMFVKVPALFFVTLVAASITCGSAAHSVRKILHLQYECYNLDF